MQHAEAIMDNITGLAVNTTCMLKWIADAMMIYVSVCFIAFKMYDEYLYQIHS